MAGTKARAATITRKLGHELVEYGLVSTYLFICFAAILFYKLAVLRGEGISYLPHGLAAIKALVLGKFLLLGTAARIGDRYDKRRFIFIVADKALLFLVMLLVLSVIEEVVVGVVRGRAVAASLADVAGGTLLEVLASCVLMLLVLTPYIAFRELNNVLGEGRLRQILLEQHVAPPAGRRDEGHEG